MGRLKPPQDSTYMMIIKQPIFVTHFICLICTHLLSKSFGRLIIIMLRKRTVIHAMRFGGEEKYCFY